MSQRLKKPAGDDSGSQRSNGRHRSQRRRVQPYAWLGAGALTLGLGAALAGGAGIAYADSDAGSGAGKTASSNSDSSAGGAAKSDSNGPTSRGHSARTGTSSSSDGVVGKRSAGLPKPAAAAVDSNEIPTAAATVAEPVAAASVTAPQLTSTSRTGRAGTNTAAAVPLPAADPSFSMTSWLPSTPITPGTSVQVALQQIADAQALLDAQTWGSGNVIAGAAAIVPQMLLSGASSSLTNWQTSVASAQQQVADTVDVPIVHQIAQLSLLNTLMQPSIAGAQLNVAALLIPLVSLLGASGVSPAVQLVKSAQTNGRVYAVVPIQMIGGTEPVVYISVNGGPRVPVLIDTGSSGLVLSPAAMGSGAGAPTGTGTSGYSGGLTYDYTTYNATVDFGNGVTTVPTSVNVVNSDDAAAFTNYFAPAGVVGVLGIGANAVGPGPSHPATSLPGELSDGVLIYQGLGILVFGPNPLPVRVSVPGTPNANLQIQVGNGAKVPVNAIIDSGGVHGTMPAYIIGNSQTSGNLPSGTRISVYTNDGQTLLYSYTTSGSERPTVITDTLLNTGNEPFQQGPIYIDYSPSNGIGSTSFDYV